MDPSLLEKAIQIAQKAHEGQKDKYDQPYIMHVIRVMNRGETLEERICGILHDVIEDSDMTLEDLRAAGFPESIVEVVGILTKPDGADYDLYVKKAAANSLARRVKLNDLQDNMDLRRVTRPLKEKDFERINKYIRAYQFLLDL